ncbi:glycine zipper 2TM domain-containing protein [Crenobacter sp. SG2303]|uniref:Glycine zipper 2TM domain-containing protein n=1 Tax=Crenobacter oryzisoli TaxID=3056844 RepID=A0ABT7XS25_9NEIS|nr:MULTISPECIES: glycine zipper 2TM domain-containing protein [unclassified Crenobacter]MDN0076344.1 glycine zipper 2TM domain-containing protein [Crenobacter sp. SG2303]MDN0084862.1 glycine zipper 2TM domain-containing protein [Crenobacter sp. SG2305]
MVKQLTRMTLIGATCLGVLAGCTTSDSAAVYSKSQMRQAQNVEFGTVVSVQNVKMEGENNELLTVGGAALGGLAGSEVGHGNGSIAGAIVGALAGGFGTKAIQHSAGTKPALEITVKLDRTGHMISIVQEADIPFVAGQRVRVLTGGGNDRVSPM